MSTKVSNIIILIIILFSLGISIYLYSQMPDRMASHWNAKGEVDGYMSKFWGLFLLPIVSVGMLILFLIIPKIDPLKENIKKFRKYYNLLIVLIIIFLFYIYTLTIIWNLGKSFDMTRVLIPGLGILFFYIGIILKHAKRNWFVGIRTPWTLSSEMVWDKTHKIGSELFKIAGIIAVLGIFFPRQAIYLVIIPVIAVTIFTVVYSYIEYQKDS